jgi:protein O-GlcNAc transferase
VLARKPAPVIATWLGYLNTTGLPAVDFRITDARCDPPGAEAYNTEKLVRLPHGHSCFEAPGVDLPVALLPALRAGRVCFGSFNKSSKLNGPTLQLWARVLQSVPGSTLLMFAVDPGQQEPARGALRALGIGDERVECVDRMALEPMLALHGRVDIALDTHPYNGTTTTFNSLWMGVPVLTLAGEGPISRTGASILGELGRREWVASSRDEYVKLCAALAADLPALARTRAGLRPALEGSPLMDGPAFTRDLERCYLEMWESS